MWKYEDCAVKWFKKVVKFQYIYFSKIWLFFDIIVNPIWHCRCSKVWQRCFRNQQYSRYHDFKPRGCASVLCSGRRPVCLRPRRRHTPLSFGRGICCLFGRRFPRHCRPLLLGWLGKGGIDDRRDAIAPVPVVVGRGQPPALPNPSAQVTRSTVYVLSLLCLSE